jgi:predicted phosphate transport protein (TIGR00153 family)
VQRCRSARADVAPEHPVWEKAAEIKDVEHRCDQIGHEVLQRLHRTFVTPIDREDIHALLQTIDDVIDDIDASADMLRLYRIQRVRPAARELAHLITASTKQVHRGLAALEARKGVPEVVAEIGRLESQADAVYQTAVGDLFETEPDPIAVIDPHDPGRRRDRCRELRAARGARRMSASAPFDPGRSRRVAP